MLKRIIIPKTKVVSGVPGKVMTMKKYFKENPPIIGEHAPELSDIIYFDVEPFLKVTLPDYQRWFEYSRFIQLVREIQAYGPNELFAIKVVLRNDKATPHDGRHRVLAFWALDINKIPGRILRFKNRIDEIRHFQSLNRKTVGLTRERDLLNKKLEGEPLASLVYKLGSQDPNSKWSDKVSLIGVNNKNEKMSVANFIKVVNWIAVGIRGGIESNSYRRANKRVQKLSYDEMLSNMNAFHDWFFTFAPTIKSSKDIFHKNTVLISMLEFYYSSSRQDLSHPSLSQEKILSTSIQKFRNYSFYNLTTFDLKTAPDHLFEHYNLVKPGKMRKHPVKRIFAKK